MGDFCHFFSAMIIFHIYIISQAHGILVPNEEEAEGDSTPYLRPLKVTGAKADHPGIRRYGILNTESFMRAVDSRYFVDRTMLIRQFFKSREEHMVFHGPMRFGKTVNMDMIREFVELKTDENGFLSERNNLTKRKVFEKLAIGQDKKVFGEFFAAFPVIHFVFDMATDSYDEFLGRFAFMIKDEYYRHGRKNFFNYGNYNSPKQALADNPELVRIFKKYTIDPQKLSESELLDAGDELANLLNDTFRRPVILLVDEYDGPITHALFNKKISANESDKIITFLTRFLKSLINPSKKLVKRSLLTGITRLGSTYTLEINNLRLQRIFDDPLIAPYYGFTREEVINLTKKFSVPDAIDAMTDYYDGFGMNGGSSMFCTMSVNKFLNSRELYPYWGPFSHLPNSIITFEKMGAFLDENIDKVFTLKIKDKIQKTDFLMLKRYIEDGNYTDSKSPAFHFFLQILLDEGVFTTVRRASKKTAEIKITNLEVKEQLFKRMYTPEFYLKKFKIPAVLLENYTTSAKIIESSNSRFIRFKNSINALLNQLQPSNEADMQSALCGALQAQSYKIFSPIFGVNVVGRVKNLRRKQSKSENHDRSKLAKSIYDFSCSYVLHKQRAGFIGIILELKYKKGSSMEALEQILDGQYSKTFDHDIKKPNLFDFETEVLIGIHYDPIANKTSLSYLWNSQDLEKARHV